MQRIRLNKFRELLEKKYFDAAVITDLPNIFYLCGFTGSTAVLVVTHQEAVIVVDSRYTLQAKQECQNVEVTEFQGISQMKAVGGVVSDLKPQKVVYESDNLTVARYNELRSASDSMIRFRGTKSFVKKLRSIKDATEIALCKEAAKITDQSMKDIHAKLIPGVSEKEIERDLIYILRKNGADKEGFDPIIAFEKNAACPHASPTLTTLKNDSFVKLDFGACFKNYNADITRTVAIGDPGEKFYKIYDIVLGAQMAAIESVKPGRSGQEIDKIARDYISSAGYRDNFGHGLGHALGIEVHDGPGFSPLSDVVLEPGMIITVEPGIYIEGWGGIRIEDDVVVSENGCEVITHYPK